MGVLINGVDGLGELKVDVGDASAGTLGSLYAIFGNWTVTVLTAIGYEGATALASKLTAARAALLDQITAVRMAELDAANVPADVDTLKAAIGAIEGATALHNKLTAARSGYLDSLSGGPVALAASWTAALATALGNYTAARAAYLDNINQAGLLQVTAARAALLDQITAVRLAELDAANIPADIDKIPKSDGAVSWNATALAAIQAQAAAALAATANKRQVGVHQVFQKAVTSAANAGDVVLATITTQGCVIDSIVVKAVTAVQTDLTSAAVAGGAAKVIVFLSATDAAKANIDAIDEQVAWTGAVELAATKTIIMTLVGVGITAVNLLVTFTYHAVADGGYLA